MKIAKDQNFKFVGDVFSKKNNENEYVTICVSEFTDINDDFMFKSTGLFSEVTRSLEEGNSNILQIEKDLKQKKVQFTEEDIAEVLFYFMKHLLIIKSEINLEQETLTQHNFEQLPPPRKELGTFMKVPLSGASLSTPVDVFASSSCGCIT
jgi:hypothetical protein